MFLYKKEMEEFDEVAEMENYMEKLDQKLGRQKLIQKTKNGTRLFTPFFGKFSNCECVRSRSDAGRVIGIKVKGPLKNRFLGIETRLQEFAEDRSLPSDFKLVRNGYVWAVVPHRIPKHFVGDVTLRFDRIFYGDGVQFRIEVVGLNGNDGIVSFMDAETALDYLKNHNEV